MKTTIILSRTEAKEEATSLTKNLGREIIPSYVDCDCDYDSSCGRCAGEGSYYEMIYAKCDHVVQEDDGDEGCTHPRCVKSVDSLPREHSQLPLHQPFVVERDEQEVA